MEAEAQGGDQGWRIEPVQYGVDHKPSMYRATFYEGGVPSRIFMALLYEDCVWLRHLHESESTAKAALRGASANYHQVARHRGSFGDCSAAFCVEYRTALDHLAQSSSEGEK